MNIIDQHQQRSQAIVDRMPEPLRAIPYAIDGERFVSRGIGIAADVVVRSIARRVAANAVTLWPTHERGLYRAAWFDDEREVFCEATVEILQETALGNREAA